MDLNELLLDEVPGITGKEELSCITNISNFIELCDVTINQLEALDASGQEGIGRVIMSMLTSLSDAWSGVIANVRRLFKAGVMKESEFEFWATRNKSLMKRVENISPTELADASIYRPTGTKDTLQTLLKDLEHTFKLLRPNAISRDIIDTMNALHTKLADGEYDVEGIVKAAINKSNISNVEKMVKKTDKLWEAKVFPEVLWMMYMLVDLRT